MKRFRRNPLAITGSLIILAFVLVAIFAPQLTATSLGRTCVRDLGLSRTTLNDVRNPLKPVFWRSIVAPPETCYDMPRLSYSPIPTPPDPAENVLLGTTSGGYDIYTGLIWGARTAFRIGVIVVGIGMSVGIIIGALAGYFGGWLDNLLMRLTDIVIAFPALILSIVIVSILGQSLINVMIALAIVNWTTYARLLRGDILRVKEQEFIDGARALGSGHLRVIFRHVLPNALGPFIVVASLDIGSVVIAAAALSFLGLGPPVGYADWGQMISFARQWIVGPPGQPFAYWYVSFWPGFVIVLFGLGWNLLGDAFRDVIDPRSQ